MRFLDILVVLRLDFDQISFNLVENALATRQLALLATRIAFYTFWLGHAQIWLFDFWNFFSFPFSTWLTFYWACLRLKTSEKETSRRPISTMEQLGVVAGNFALSFSLIFLRIFVHISGFIRLITLIWASLERSFLRGRGGGYLIYPLVGRCGVALTLFKTNIADFPTLFKTEFRFLIPCLRHLTRILINKSL